MPVVKPRVLNCSSRSCGPFIHIACLLLLGVLPAVAIIDLSLQMQLGNPSNASADPANHNHYLIQRTVEAIDYSDSLGVANWASWDLTTSDYYPSTGRTGSYAPDTTLPPGFYQVTSSDYSNPDSYDRGHMCPSGDRTDNETDNQLVFYLSNFIPQAADNNQGVWESFESYIRNTLVTNNEVLITCGPSGFTGARVPSGKVAIPQYVWKIVVVVPITNGVSVLDRINTSTRVIALKTPNTNGLSRSIAWQTFVTSVNQIQADTGYTFFTALPADLASVLRAKVDGQTIPAPAITGFSPGTGPVNTVVTITGTNFASASSVRFNGANAAFTVDSTLQITATVPAGATSGAITVTTPGGVASSAGSFTVNSVPTPDLVLAVTHTSTFFQGDSGDVYTIVITNIGTAASTGMVSVTNILPAGLTATAISGTGWTPNLSSTSCTRADSLGMAAGYPPITVTVTVTAGAAASVTNTATVSGGGDTNLANNTASDPTTVQAASAPAVVTSTASVVTPSSATVNGTVDPNNQTATSWFEYGMTTSYGATGAVSGTLTGTTAQVVSATLTGLNPGLTYHYRVSATNILGAASGMDQTFATAVGGGGSVTTLAGWDVSTLTNKDYGPSPLAPTTNDARLTIGWLTRGSGVATGTGAAARAWGGVGFVDTSAAAAVAANRFATCSVTPNTGYQVSYASISRFDYRRSGTGPTNGLMQYQVGAGGFSDIAAVSYSSSSSSGASLGPIDLTGISALQNVSAGTLVTFRLINWGGGSGGTWYIFDIASNSSPDLEIQGTVSPVVVAAPDLALGVTHTGSFTQADIGDTCTITVTNMGSAASAGIVSLSNTLSSALTATAMSGTGWTVNLGTLTCTRADALAAGASYPPITVTVNVATNAPASITNLAIVSGGGDTVLANNSASDSINVIALTPIQAWRLQWFGTTANSGLAADSAVRTSDGLPNLVKYALGLDPLVAVTNPVVGDVITGHLRLTSPKNPSATDVTFSVEVAGNVQSGWATNGTAMDQNTSTQLQVHDNTAVSSAPERFLRLRVSRP